MKRNGAGGSLPVNPKREDRFKFQPVQSAGQVRRTPVRGSSQCKKPVTLCSLGKKITSVPQFDVILNMGNERCRETDS
jgi:hypothetical protein